LEQLAKAPRFNNNSSEVVRSLIESAHAKEWLNTPFWRHKTLHFSKKFSIFTLIWAIGYKIIKEPTK
jgi:hypothetical protein